LRIGNTTLPENYVRRNFLAPIDDCIGRRKRVGL